MKSFNSHLFSQKRLQYLERFPKSPKIVLFGAPNVGTTLFAHRLAMDVGVPAVSMRNIYRTLFANQEYYRQETFYRNVINLLREYHNKGEAEMTNINKELENNMIPEKLLILTKYTEMGFVLYDYPNTLKQCENLETLNGGINLFVNLLLNREIAVRRESGKSQCSNCNKEYNRSDVVIKEKNICWTSSYPENNTCVDCGSDQLVDISGSEAYFGQKWDQYESQSRTILPFYQKLGLLLNYEVKNGLRDYEVLRQKVQHNIKH